ncbi:hypothetical protein GWE18_39865 [Bradyrhizobium sp. CSA112]|uniref:thiamine pyrophosphate-dependent enzyme n=1 Tax=Bradyrhizobium sp. CSA112 TaxID=2699170 RepID=UPI0023AEAFDE|nr:thiamine pyrophosphate-dependent enzyme [Bradyrhizobium sp. CSA112]MDE5458791.1 hypothetical protein [Bradyrhizobium sp. CSA112]
MKRTEIADGYDNEFYNQPEAPKALQILEALEQAGVTHMVALADNWTVRLHELIASGKSSIKLVHTCREGENVPIAAGLLTAGKKPVLMMQNSGFHESLDSVRFGIEFGLPLVTLIGYRGWGNGSPNIRGRFTEPTLRAWDIPYEILDDAKKISAIGRALELAERRQGPTALLFPGIGGRPATKDENSSAILAKQARMDYLESLRCLASHRTDQLVITHETADRVWPLISKQEELDVVGLGLMSKAGSLGLGIAMAHPDRKVWVLDGDGSLAMNLGCLATEADVRPRNLVHFVIQNFEYEITAKQAFPMADGIDFAAIARACGIPRAFTFDDIGELKRGLPEVLSGDDLTFVSLKVKPAGKQAGPHRQLMPEGLKYLRTLLAGT